MQVVKAVVGVAAVWVRARRSLVGTRREWRRRQALQVRLAGRYGPQWWEMVLPALVLLVAAMLPLFTLAWLWIRVGAWAAAVGVVVFGFAGRWGVLRRRAVAAARARHHGLRYTLAEVDAAAATEKGFRAVVGRLLVRDGWEVRGTRLQPSGVVHLVGQRNGQRLGCAFDFGAGTGDDGRPRGAAALRSLSLPAGGDEAGGRSSDLMLIVSPGSFDRGRVVWAARTGVHLVDRGLLERWAAGERLDSVLDLDRAG